MDDETKSPEGALSHRVSIRGIAPNVVTILALIAGVTGVKFALAGFYEKAVAAIILAGILDGLDGTLARLLKSTSRFGAELDSLSDVVSFGVAPALILYLWGLNQLGGIGWVITLTFVVCMALRLARFNSRMDDEDEPRKKAGYLTGFPAPVAAALAFLPLVIGFEFGDMIAIGPEVVGICTALVSMGMVSRLATFSPKSMVIARDKMIPVLLVVGLLAASITVYGWSILLVIAVLYLGSIPWTQWRFFRSNRGQK